MTMNNTQRRNIEKVMQAKVRQFRNEHALRTIDEIVKDGFHSTVTDKQYEAYEKAHASLVTAQERYKARFESMVGAENNSGRRGYPHVDPTTPKLWTREDIENLEAKYSEHRTAHQFSGWVNDENAAESISRNIRMAMRESLHFEACCPRLVAWYEQDTRLAAFANEDLVVSIWIDDGDSQALVERLTEQLNSLI